MNVNEFIQENWKNSVRFTPDSTESHIGLPYTYTVPCCDRVNFNEMYYWDTYFTNKGLLLNGQRELAENNCKNIFTLIERYGYMPNGSQFFYIGRSQPPYLAFMVFDIYKTYGDKEWLLCSLPYLKKEYRFWMTERISENGLNRYFANYSDEEYKRFFVETVCSRLRFDKNNYSEEEKIIAGRHYMAEAESGWDFNPRFDGRCADFNPVDLNANLYFYENLLEQIEKSIGGDGKEYRVAYESRAEKIKKYLYDEQKKLFFDYDYKNGRRSDVISAAAFQPYYVQLDGIDSFGAINLYNKLINENGISATASGYGTYQWAYPNAWAPLQLIAYDSLVNAGYRNEASALAEKFIKIVEKVYEKTGNLWEKYNSANNDIPVDEYKMPPMLGWTAGTYVYLQHELKKQSRSKGL